MKLRLIACAVATLATSSAFAAPINADTAVQIHMSGASAVRAALGSVVLNDVCGGLANNTATIYNATYDAAGGFKTNSNFWAVTCKLPAAKLGLAAGTNIAFFKSDAGGSAQGVFPVYYGSARPFANLSTCTSGSGQVFSGCLGNRMATPNLGMSDVEPGMFVGANVPADPLDADDNDYPTSGLTSAQQGELKITPVIQTVFAVAVNTALYNDMFAKQGLSAKKDSAGAACTTSSNEENCIPSIGKAEASTFFTGNAFNWKMLSANAALNTTQVNVCRRVKGSGSQAAANMMFGGRPCSATGLEPAGYDTSTSAAPEDMSAFANTTVSGLSIPNYLLANMGAGSGMPGGEGLFVFEGPGTGDVITCMNAAQSNGGYAIGHISKENAPGSNSWKHVRLEGAMADGNNAKQGRYDYLVESTVQYKKSAFAALSPEQKSFITGFTAEIAKPSALNTLSSANKAGILALPTSYAGDFGTGTVAEVTFGSRVNRGGNSCAPLIAVK
ncbi:hypothetical protein [Paucibacter sp. KCTC 42545]|uniref:hypothetical protein n=1 Tax=Paucibacter sp. KCTC 42545 TaxID=1768242 RepID=UPI000733BDDE|nr:hypothetical protein [Paucibacter sp. KCTC 42545]ALT76245.1 hypothetical protein AT984_02505 [Paucibacter sp. KCTC 42545]